MAKVVGFEEKLYKRYTCRDCCAIIECAPNEIYWNEQTDEGSKIMVVDCPNCGKQIRTNP